MVWSWLIVPLLDGVELDYCFYVGWCGAGLLFLCWMVWSRSIVPLLDGVELAYCSSVGWCGAGLLFLF